MFFNLRIVRFLLSGGLAACIELIVFILLMYLIKDSLLVVNAASFIAGLATSFALNRGWVFSSKTNIKRQMTLYVIAAGINLLISTSLVWFMVNIGLVDGLAKVVSMIMVAAWNYILFSKIIFKTPEEHKS